MDLATLEGKPAFAVTRHYPVAPGKVWRAWTDAQALKRWWGPFPGDPVSVVELDVCVGGRFRIVFGGPAGDDNECAGEYRVVEPERRLVFSWHWPRTTPDRVSQVTLVFHAVPGGTDLEFRHEGFFDDAARDGHQRGWGVSLERLHAYLHVSKG